MSTLNHPNLGVIRGIHHDGVIQYLGIKYGSLTSRFAPSTVNERVNKSFVLDATSHGCVASSPLIGCDLEFGLIQHDLPKTLFPQSDLECLNLNITLPEEILSFGSTRLPVLVYIHGGGFAIGSNSWPQYDHSRIVRLSVELGSPIIGVGINYRLGAPGFLTSRELRNAGYKPNNGLVDQKNALKWVKKHIGGFHGDDQNVTLVGQSAGGVSSILQLESPEPLFKRLISMSGSPLFMQPLSLDVHEQLYDKVINALGLSNATPEERLKLLEQAPSQDIISAIPPTVPFLPALDGETVSKRHSFSGISGQHEKDKPGLPLELWCEELLIGDCRMDGSILSVFITCPKAGIGKAFASCIRDSLASSDPTIVSSLLSAYNISGDTNDDAAYHAILQFGNDLNFLAPTLTYASGWHGKAFVYHLNEPNPWHGPWEGASPHCFDIALLFQNYREYLPVPQQTLGKDFATAFVRFVAGTPIWEPFTMKKPLAMAFGRGGNHGLGMTPTEVGRRSLIFEYADQLGFDALAAAWQEFLALR